MIFADVVLPLPCKEMDETPLPPDVKSVCPITRELLLL